MLNQIFYPTANGDDPAKACATYYADAIRLSRHKGFDATLRKIRKLAHSPGYGVFYLIDIETGRALMGHDCYEAILEFYNPNRAILEIIE